jgi:hypothetical protein
MDVGSDNNERGVLVAGANALGDLVTGLPEPIRNNAFSALGRLVSTVIEVPTALIENYINEKRAESQGRVKVTTASADQIAQRMQTDPSYVRAAANKYAHKIVRERVNLDQIAFNAAEELKSTNAIADQTRGAKEGAKEPDGTPISEDWLNVFENEAAQMSSEQMQRLFGKILAGEIRRPTSYSIKTVKLMAQLDNEAAELFRVLAPFQYPCVNQRQESCSKRASRRWPAILVITRSVLTASHIGQSAFWRSMG